MALNRELQMVKLSVESREKNKARFDYVENLKEEKKDKRKKAIKVELSIAAKTKQRKQQKEKEKEKEEEKDDDDVEMKGATASTEKKEAGKEESSSKMEVDEDGDGGDATESEKKKKKKKGDDDDKKEGSKYNVLENPSRVTPNQVKYVQWVDTRYKPLTARFQGFVMVQDTKPDLETELVEQKEIALGGVYGDEPDPPEPFLFLRD